jgi:murein DD-endopeptidase MepM/ murein hydrolase activator NlpD
MRTKKRQKIQQFQGDARKAIIGLVGFGMLTTLVASHSNFAKRQVASDTNFKISINSFMNKSPISEAWHDFKEFLHKRKGASSCILEKMQNYDGYVKEAARKYMFGDTNTVWAMMMTESEMDPNDISRAGARGLMQILPSIAAMHMNTGIDIDFKLIGKKDYEDAIYQKLMDRGIDIMDPRTNIELGAQEFAGYIKMFGSPELMHAAYNAGEGSVKKYKGIPPFAETQYHVPKVLSLKDCLENMQWPVERMRSANIGHVLASMYHVKIVDSGIMIPGKEGAPVVAALDGNVASVGRDEDGSSYVIIEKIFKYKGSKLVVIRMKYSNLASLSVQPGQNAKTGSKIGEIGKGEDGGCIHFTVSQSYFSRNKRYSMYFNPLIFLSGKDRLYANPDGTIVRAGGETLASARYNALGTFY